MNVWGFTGDFWKQRKTNKSVGKTVRIFKGLMYSIKKIFLTFSKSKNIVTEIVNSLLSVYKLTQTTHKTVSLVVTVVSLIGKLNFISSLNTFWDDVRYKSLCERRKERKTLFFGSMAAWREVNEN